MKGFIAAVVISGLFVAWNSRQRKREDPPIFYVKQLTGGFTAKTIPPFGIYILEKERGNIDLLQHELVHWRQFKKLGLVKFYSSYISQLQKFGYDNMPMEIEARNNENEYCKRNYTECVRTGMAKTVFNPRFRV